MLAHLDSPFSLLYTPHVLIILYQTLKPSQTFYPSIYNHCYVCAKI